MARNFISAAIILTHIFLMMHAVGVHADELYFIDAHSQVDHMVVPLKTVISVMKQGGVTCGQYVYEGCSNGWAGC